MSSIKGCILLQVIGDIHGQFCDLVNIFTYTNGEHLIRREGGSTTNQDILLTSSDPSPEEEVSCPSTNPSHEEEVSSPPLPMLINGYYSFDSKPIHGHNSIKKPYDPSYLFLGDYVDRGCYSSECILFLLALKVAYPSRFFMLRGNHESRCMTQFSYSEGINFAEECQRKYGEEAYESFMKCFDSLPLAAIVENKFGKWLCCHGGIG